MGDSVLLVPLLRWLKQLDPAVHIGLLVTSGSRQVLAGCPYVDSWQVWSRKKAQVVWRDVANQQYDTAVLLRPSLTDALALRRAGIPQRFGYDYQRIAGSCYVSRGWGLTQRLIYPHGEIKQHQVRLVAERVIPALTGQPVPTDDTAFIQSLWPQPEAVAHVKQRLQSLAIASDPSRLAVIHLAAASLNKDIAVDKVLPALVRLAEAGYTLIATGPSQQQQPYGEGLVQPLEQMGVRLHNWAGQTNLSELVALLAQSELVLGLDSAPLHMAAAVGVPAVVGIYGATHPAQWAPWPHRQLPSGNLPPYPLVFEPVSLSLPCKPCLTKTCQHTQCREDITSGHVLLAVERALHRLQRLTRVTLQQTVTNA